MKTTITRKRLHSIEGSHIISDMIVMDRLPTSVVQSSDDFASRKQHNIALITELRERMETAQGGGGGKYVERHQGRGKGMPRDRISEICDPGLHSWSFPH